MEEKSRRGLLSRLDLESVVAAQIVTQYVVANAVARLGLAQSISADLENIEREIILDSEDSHLVDVDLMRTRLVESSENFQALLKEMSD